MFWRFCMAFNPWQDDDDPWNKKGKKITPAENLFDFLEKKLSSLFKSNHEGGTNSPKSGKNGVLILVGCATILYLGSGFFQVQPNERGVILRFGKWVRTVDSGLHYALPAPFEMVLLPKVTRVNRVDIKASGNASENLALTGDLNLADITFSVLWKIKNNGAEQYLFCDRNPELTVKAVAESVMREIVGQTPFAYLQTEGRGEIQNKAREKLQAVVDEYNMGIDIIRVELRLVEPPSSVIDSFRDVERAQAEQQSERNKADAYARDVKARTSGLIAEKLNKGEAEKRKKIAEAEGITARFLAVYEQYKHAPDVISNRLYISTCKEILQQVKKVIVDENIKVISCLPDGKNKEISQVPAIEGDVR